MRKNIFKRVISVALVVAMATVMLTGCGDSGKEDDGKTVLSLGIWPSDDLVDNVAMHEGYVEKFNEINPDVTVKPDHYVYATDTFVSLAESGNCPTIFETWFTEPQKLINQGLVTDITEQLKERGWDTQMNSSILEILSDKDGKIYGIARDAYALGIMCNVELFEAAGLVDKDGVPIFPKTWDELAQTAKTIKDKTGAAGFCLLAKDNSGGWHFSNLAWCFGATLCIDNGDGTYTSNLASPEAIAAMKYVYDLKWKYDVLTADPTSEDWTSGFQNIGTGACAMYIGGNDAVDQPTQVFGLDVTKLAIGPIPAGPNGDQYSLTGGTPYMFAKDATPEEIDAALDYLEIMGKTPDVNDTLRLGLQQDAANRQKNGVPVLKTLPCWTNQERSDAEAQVIAEYQNVNPKMFDSFFAATEKENNLRSEEPGDAQKMYEQITNVLQTVVTDKDCDIEELMKKANDNYQKILDSKFTKK